MLVCQRVTIRNTMNFCYLCYALAWSTHITRGGHPLSITGKTWKIPDLNDIEIALNIMVINMYRIYIYARILYYFIIYIYIYIYVCVCFTNGTYETTSSEILPQPATARAPEDSGRGHGSLIGTVEAGEARIEGVAGRPAAREDPAHGKSW